MIHISCVFSSLVLFQFAHITGHCRPSCLQRKQSKSSTKCGFPDNHTSPQEHQQLAVHANTAAPLLSLKTTSCSTTHNEKHSVRYRGHFLSKRDWTSNQMKKKKKLCTFLFSVSSDLAWSFISVL